MKSNMIEKRLIAMAILICLVMVSFSTPVLAGPEVNNIYVNGITIPEAGKNPDMVSVSVASDQPYTVMNLFQAFTEVNTYNKLYTGEYYYDPIYVASLNPSANIQWFKSSDAVNWDYMLASDVFEIGFYYKALLYISMDTSANVLYSAIPVYLNGENNEGGSYHHADGIPYGGPVEVIFTNLTTRTLSVFGVDEVVEPVAGEKPNFSSAYLYSKACSIGNQKDFWSWYIPYGKSHADTDFFNSFSDSFINAIPSDAKIMWLESTDGENWEYMIDRKTGAVSSFEYGKYYKVEIIIDIPESGYQVSEWAWAYVNSKENVAKLIPFTKSPGNDYEISYVFENLIKNPEPEKPETEEMQEVELEDLRFTAPSEWTLDDSKKDQGEIELYHGNSESEALAVLKVKILDSADVVKNVQEGAFLSELAYQYLKTHPMDQEHKFKLVYALPEYELNGMKVFKAVGICLKASDNENAYNISNCNDERPFTQFLFVKLNGQYYGMYFINNESNFLDQMAFEQLLTTLQDMKNLSVRLEGQEFSNIMGYLQAARYCYGIDSEGQKLYSNVLEIRNLNSKAINTTCTFNIYGTDKNGQEYLIKEGLKLYGMIDRLWWLDCGDTEITRVEFTEVTTQEAANAVKYSIKSNEDGSVLTLVPEGSFNAKDVQIMLGKDQFWDYPDDGGSVIIDLTLYKDKLESWQDYSAFTINAVLYNK